MTKQGKSIKKIKAKQYKFIHHVNVHAFFSITQVMDLLSFSIKKANQTKMKVKIISVL